MIKKVIYDGGGKGDWGEDISPSYRIYTTDKTDGENYIIFLIIENKLKVAEIWKRFQDRMTLRNAYNYLEEMTHDKRIETLRTLERSCKAITKFNL